MAVGALLDGLTVDDPGRLGGTRPVAVALLTSRTPPPSGPACTRACRRGDVDIVVGTHALLTDEVRFHSLGMVVIDEQHRFGVEQRAALRDKGAAAAEPPGRAGADPDLLVMTATPIPRTAAMVLFGDLDMVVLDELPPGRTASRPTGPARPLEEAEAWHGCATRWRPGTGPTWSAPWSRDPTAWWPARPPEERAPGRRRAGRVAARAAARPDGLGRQGGGHGRLPLRRVQVLVATTVIEVGVDVAEATVMVIEDADRFGIAQLHQLRGRVGRGTDPSWCYLLAEGSTPDAASGWPPSSGPPTASSWPRSTSSCGGRGPSWGHARRAAAT